MMEKQLLRYGGVAMLERSYVPYSHFPVGAALLCKDGTVFTGCNENAAYGATICAERTAMVKGGQQGAPGLRHHVIAGRSDGYCVPCGTCPAGDDGVRAGVDGHLPEQEGREPRTSRCGAAALRLRPGLS